MITDADTRKVTFRYDAHNRIDGRKNRRGDWTTYRYDDDSRLLRDVELDMSRLAPDSAAIVTRFCAAEGRSLAACDPGAQRLDSVYTHLDGPRIDVTDTTVFYVNRFGGPDTIVNALGHKTRVERADPIFSFSPPRSFSPTASAPRRSTIVAGYRRSSPRRTR